MMKCSFLQYFYFCTFLREKKITLTKFLYDFHKHLYQFVSSIDDLLGGHLNMALLYLLRSDASVRYYTVAYTLDNCHILQGTRKKRPCLTGHPVYKGIYKEKRFKKIVHNDAFGSGHFFLVFFVVLHNKALLQCMNYFTTL